MFDRFDISISRKELILGCLAFLISMLIVAQSRWSRLHNSEAISSEEAVGVYLHDKTNLRQLAGILADSGLVKDTVELHWSANLLGWRRFQEGHYRVDRGFTYNEFLSKLARGIQDPVSVTILPGRYKSDIIQSVAGDLQFDSLEFQQLLSDTSFLETLGIQPADIPGRLYPNTYSMYWTASPETVFKRILDEFKQAVVTPHKQRYEELGKSVDEIVTLASIIEWEARNKEEKETISGLYWNRLKRGMRLQADPTVNFAVGERRRLLYKDYQVEHPYNTYQNRGLPPGPITNPSLSSIKAALYPEEHEYLFMVASPDGAHSFSETFKEHHRKSEKWREWLQKQYRIKRQREASSD